MAPRYNMTCHGVMEWAKSELEHVGRIAAVEDADIQYAYAQSTVNGMLHLRDALFELVSKGEHEQHKADLKLTHDGVVRVIKHLIKDYDVKLEDIKQFNTRHVLSNLGYLNGNGGNINRNPNNVNRKPNNVNRKPNTAKNGGRRSVRKTRRSN